MITRPTLDAEADLSTSAQNSDQESSSTNEVESAVGNENNEAMAAESLLPMRILCQLRLMPPSMLYILDEDTEFRVFKASGLGMDFDNDWQTMSHPVRHLILAIIFIII